MLLSHLLYLFPLFYQDTQQKACQSAADVDVHTL